MIRKYYPDYKGAITLSVMQNYARIGINRESEYSKLFRYRNSIDLLFYHLKLRCYIVVELKVRDFKPGDVSQLNMYQNIVNDVLRHPDDKPTIGLLLVKGKNKTVVEYSLAGFDNPIGVADWQERLTKELPEDLKSSLPTIEEIERELENDQT